MHQKNIILFLLILTSGLIGCRNEHKLSTWDIDILTPIAKSTVSISDLIVSPPIDVQPDGSLTFVYERTVFAISLDTLLDIPDTNITDSYDIFPFTYPPGIPISSDNQENYYDFKGAELRQLNIHSGTIEFKIINTLEEQIQFTYTISSASKNGIPLSVTQDVPAGTLVTPSETTVSYQLDGYEFDLTGSDGLQYNTMIFDFSANIHPNADTANPVLGSYVGVEYAFQNVIPEYAEGFFGNQTVNLQNQIDSIEIFYPIINGNIDLDEVIVALSLDNKIGVDLRANIGQITSSNSSNNQAVDIANTLVGSNVFLQRATKTAIYGYVLTNTEEFNLNKDNSNIHDFVEIMPDGFYTEVEIELNPLGNISNNDDFIYHGKGLDLGISLEIPINFAASQLTISDTLPFNFGDSIAYLPSFEGLLWLNTNNGFPYEFKPQIFLMDSNYNVFDTLAYTEGFIPAAEVNENQLVSGYTFSRRSYPISTTDIENLYATANIMVHFSLNTTNQPNHILMYNDYAMDIQIVADVNVIIDPN